MRTPTHTPSSLAASERPATAWAGGHTGTSPVPGGCVQRSARSGKLLHSFFRDSGCTYPETPTLFSGVCPRPRNACPHQHWRSGLVPGSQNLAGNLTTAIGREQVSEPCSVCRRIQVRGEEHVVSPAAAGMNLKAMVWRKGARHSAAQTVISPV